MRASAASGPPNAARQTATALFYNSSNSGTVVADAVVRYLEAIRMAPGAARLFALMHGAATDSIIVCWQQKRDVGFWRPLRAIAGEFLTTTTATPDTAPEPGWTPLVTLPNYSDYLSGHGSLTVRT